MQSVLLKSKSETSRLKKGKNCALGKEGEDFSVDYLLRKGYKIIHRNFRLQKREIDIIGLIGNELVFFEVKTRGGVFSGFPEESVNETKICRLLEVAERYMELYPSPDEFRLDVISLVKTKKGFRLTHFKDIEIS